MSTKTLATLSVACLAWFAVFDMTAATSRAQSGTRTMVPTYRSSPAPARTSRPARVAQSNPVALQGYCPVCVVDMKKWVRGNASFTAKHDGKTYYFPGDEQRQAFLKDPSKYTPALGGDCAVCLTEMKKNMPGSIQYTALHKNRLFLFPNPEIKAKFMSDPARYENVDLALGGDCAVCRVEMNKEVAGLPGVTASYMGMRYQFPSEKERAMFLANPQKYAVKKNTSSGSGTK